MESRPARSVGGYTLVSRAGIAPLRPPNWCAGERMPPGANMTRYKTAAFGAALLIAGVVTGSSAAHAQTFGNYSCADGTRFIVGFYPYDSRAHLQIDGRAVTLKRRLALSGARYSGGGVTLAITKAGTTIRHVKRRVTACELT